MMRPSISQTTNAEGGQRADSKWVLNEVYSRTGERQEMQEEPGMGVQSALFHGCKHVVGTVM